MSTRDLQGMPFVQDRPCDRRIRGVVGSALHRGRWHKRVVAVSTALLILLAIGAVGPHLVHHAFSADQEQACLLATQAMHHPWLGTAEPSVVAPQLMQAWHLMPSPLSPQAFLTATSFARAPPSSHL